MIEKRKLSSLFINLDFQGRLIAIFLIFGAFQGFVTFFVIFFTFSEIRKGFESAGGEHVRLLLDAVEMQEHFVFTFISIAFGISLLLFLFVGLRYTHQAAGALHRMKLEFESMKEKQVLHQITLRKGDFFRDVEDVFNDMVNSVSPGPVEVQNSKQLKDSSES